LKAISSIANHIPGFPILGIGGIDSADVALQFLQCGASVLQVCSAIQNQDFTVIQDYCNGLKTLLYLKSNPPPNQPHLWDGQSPPIFKNQKGKPVVPLTDDEGKPLVNFGVQKEQRDEQVTQMFKEKGPLWKLDSSDDVSGNETNGVHSTNGANAGHKTKPAPSVKDITGISLQYIGTYKKLDNAKQVVALIDDDLCINCGKCYMACADSGYQAIAFDSKTHRAHVTDDCTGCNLCLSVCPVIDCISMVPKKIPHVIKRGTAIKVQIHALSPCQ